MLNSTQISNLEDRLGYRLCHRGRSGFALTPKRGFEIRFVTPDSLERALIDGEIDLAIGWTVSRLPSLSYEQIFSETQTVFCECRHPLFAKAPTDIAPEALEMQGWVRRGCALPASVPFSISPVATALASQMEGMAHLVLSGHYIGYMPVHYAQSWVDQGRLRPILPEVLSYEIPFSLITKHSRHTVPELHRICEILLRCHLP